MKKLFSLWIILFLMTGLTPPLYAAAERPPGEACPIMHGRRVKSKFFVDYDGRRYFFCCRSCVNKFKKHPDRYADDLADAPSVPIPDAGKQ